MSRDEYGKAYERGIDLTVRLLRSRGVNGGLETDIAQAAWARGWERLTQLRHDTLVVTWINTIALNILRGMRREPKYQRLPKLITTADAMIAAVDVSGILSICAPRQREMLEEQLRGVPAEEIARRQGVTETAVRSRWLRARRAARATLNLARREV
jgi:RNA polymerase sigma-70 factor, ECF subfamily